MEIVIVGAGIGGLAAAVGLQRAGARVTVLERAAGAHPVGSGLSLFGNAFAALDALGLGDRVRALAASGLDGLSPGQRRPDGRFLARTPPSALTGVGVVHRAELHEVLLGALAPGTVRFGVEVTAVSGGRAVHLADGTVLGADVVVAADGIRSRVRAGWPDDPGLRYAGYTAWRGVTERPVELGGVAGETWGRGVRFGIAPLRDGRVYWFGVATRPAGGSSADEHAEVAALVGGWHAPIAALLEATPREAVLRHDIHDLASPLPTFRRGRCVLLGDAAHAMTPDLGQGAAQALEDATTLAALLSPGADIDGALDTYDRLRRPRTQKIAAQARTMGRVAQLAGPLAAVRDAALRLVPQSATARQLREVQNWRPQHVPTPAG